MCLDSEREREMALEAGVFQQDRYGGYGSAANSKDLCSWVGGGGGGGGGGGINNYNHLGTWDFGPLKEEVEGGGGGGPGKWFLDNLETQMVGSCYDLGGWNVQNSSSPSASSMASQYFMDMNHLNSYSPEADRAPEGLQSAAVDPLGPEASAAVVGRAKRRRLKSRKNKEDIENQRMTHIAVERNRRKQMNEYLSVLRSLMPDSYVQRGDQASIIGGAINFVKELEQRLQFLGTQDEEETKSEESDCTDGGGGSGSGSGVTVSSLPFSDFFAFPQYSMTAASMADGGSSASTVADVEVNMVETHASIKIRARKRPKHLLRTVSGLQKLRLTVLHLNVTTVAQTALYSLSVKVEDECGLNSVDEIATAVHQLLASIQEEAFLN